MNVLAPTRVWASAAELAEAQIPGLPSTARGLRKGGWLTKCRRQARTGKGGGFEFHVLDLKLNDVQKERWDAYCLSESVLELPAAPVETVRTATSTVREEDATSSATVDGAAGSLALPGTSEYEELRGQLWREFERKRQPVKDAAVNRAAATARAIDLIEAGGAVMESYRVAGAEFSFSLDSVELFVKKIGGHKNPKFDRSDFAAVLIDRRDGRHRPSTYDLQVFESYKSDYLRSDCPPRLACYRRALLAAKNRGVPEDQIASEPTLWRRLRQQVPWQSILFARKGAQALHRTYPAQRRDRSSLYAGQAVNGDGYRWNLAALWPDGEICRPLMFYFKDEFSGKILAWRLDKTENWGLVRLTIGDLIRDVCIPQFFTIDNTMAAAAKQITGGSTGRFRFKIRNDDPDGLIQLLGSRVCNTLPRVGGSSKSGERGGGDWDRDLARHPAVEGCWLGHNTATRPESARRIIPIEELIPIIGEGIVQHNQRRGRDTQNCRGTLSFDECFSESYPKHAHQKPTAEQLRLCMLAAENVVCRKIDGAIKLFGNVYWSPTTSALAGQRVVVRFDPERLHESVFIYSHDGKAIGEAECRLPEGFHDVDAARTHNRLRRQNLKRHKEIARNARTMTALELAAQLPTSPEPEPASSKVVRLFRLPIEAPRAVAAADFDEGEGWGESAAEQAKWRNYRSLKRRPMESLDADERAAIKIFEASAAYQIHLRLGRRVG